MRRKFDMCPLGGECEKVERDAEGQYISTCHWYVEVRGKHPQSEEQISDWRCALAWLPVIGIENSQTNRGQTAAIEGLRKNILAALISQRMLSGDKEQEAVLIEENEGGQAGE